MTFIPKSANIQSSDSMKEALTSKPCLAYFQLNAPTHVMSDAGPVGLGALLLQRQEDGHNKPVTYTSRSLTPTERPYLQESVKLSAVFGLLNFSEQI